MLGGKKVQELLYCCEANTHTAGARGEVSVARIPLRVFGLHIHTLNITVSVPPCPWEQASSTYVECAGLEYADFMSLVHADMEVLADAADCFKGKVEEIEVGARRARHTNKQEDKWGGGGLLYGLASAQMATAVFEKQSLSPPSKNKKRSD